MIEVISETVSTDSEMKFETRYTWDKLVLELKILRHDDQGSIVPLCIGIQTLLWPDENVENCWRQVQFMRFEILKACEGKSEAESWQTLRDFVFDKKSFQLISPRSSETHEDHLLMNSVLDKREGHPLAVVLLALHLAQLLDLPITLVRARHHFLLKWVRSGKTVYLDMFAGGRPLTDQDLVRVLNRTPGGLEAWSARELLAEYLELLRKTFEEQNKLHPLHTILNLILQLDEGNTEILGQRALVRQRLGFQREALGDLKRYFSFIEKVNAPAALQQAWLELEHVPEPQPRGPSEILH